MNLISETISDDIYKPKKGNILFLILGIFALSLAPFDLFLEKDYDGFAYDIAWAGLFFFLFTKEKLRSRLNPISLKISQYCLIAGVIVTGSVKFLNKLYIKDIL